LRVRGDGHPELPRAWRACAVNADGDLDEMKISLLAVLNSPHLRAARMQMKVARARLVKAGLLSDPQLNTSFDLPTSKDSSLLVGYNFSLGFNLRSLITLGARKDAAVEGARATYLKVLWQEWQVIQQARILYRRALIQQRKLALLYDQFLKSRRTWEKQKIALEQGNATRDQEGLALTPMMAARVRWVELRRQFNATAHDLALLLGLDPSVRLPLSPPPGGLESLLRSPPEAKQLQAILLSIGERRPDLLALRAGYQSQESTVREQILMQFPNFTVGAERLRDTGGVWTLGPLVNLNLPLLNVNRGNIAIARGTRQRLRAEYHYRIASAYVQARKLARNQRLALNEWRGLTSRLPRLAITVKRMAHALKVGEIGMLTFTTLRKAYFSQRARSLTLEQNILEQTVALEALTGTLLPSPVQQHSEGMKP